VKDEAKALRLGGHPEKSVELMQPIADSLAATGAPDGYISQELAEGLYGVGRIAEAKPHFAIAYELLSKDTWAMQAEPEKVERMRQMSQ